MSNYYGTTSNAQSDPRRYPTHTNSTAQSTAYQTQPPNANDSRQNQYDTASYAWANPQPNATVDNMQHTYANGSWHDRSTTSNAYNYSREVHSTTEPSYATSQNYQSRDPYNSQNAQGLNHLAYASGLEPAVSLNITTQQPRTQSAADYKSGSLSVTSQARTASPANAGTRYGQGLQQPAQSAQSASYSNQRSNSPTSAGSHDLAMNAAAALAGAVRGRYSQSSQVPAVGSQVRPSNLPSVSNARSNPAPATPAKPSPLSVTPLARYNTQTSNSVRASSGTPNIQPQTHVVNTTNNVRPAAQTQITQRSQTQDHSQSATQNTAQRSTQSSNPQSIANLVSSSNQEEQQADESVETPETMPSYIDPSQVFNPYHREHKRKQLEAAEAEARRKAQEAEEAERNRRAAQEAAKKVPETSAAANSKSKITKKPSAASPSRTAQQPNQPATGTTEIPPSEDIMAAEMQKWMAKMKEFKSTNPVLFQKLLNDMRGSGASSTPAQPAATQSPSPQITQAALATHGERTAAVTPATIRKAKPSSATTGTVFPLNGFRVVVEDNPEGLPDLGRFPAERRIRQRYGKHSSEMPGASEVSEVSPTAKASTAVPPLPSTSITGQTTTPAASGTTLEPTGPWGEPRRRAVAISAFHLLKSNPDNASIQITAQDICLLLERNPSYLDLCTALEARGMKFQRSNFARDLLKSVPDLSASAGKHLATAHANGNQTSVATSAPSLVLPVGQTEAVDTAMTVPAVLSNIDQAFLHEGLTAPLTPTPAGPSAVKDEFTKPPAKASAKMSKPRGPQAGRLEAFIGSKEAAARKRSFAELIDLTELGDDENYVLPPAKQPRLDANASGGPVSHQQTTILPGFGNSTAQPLRFNPNPRPKPLPQAQSQPKTQVQTHTESSVPLQTPSQQKGQTHQSGFGEYSPPVEVIHGRRVFLAKPLNSSEALEKSYYDPRTVARDILIASGRHTTEFLLNHHLLGLLHTYIEIDADLTTFDWDSIDPGGPPAPKVDYVDILAAPPQFKHPKKVRKPRGQRDTTDHSHLPKEERLKWKHATGSTHEARASGSQHPSTAPLSLQPTLSANIPTPVDGRKTSYLPHHNLNGVHVTNSTSKLRTISIDIPTTSSQRVTHATPQPQASKPRGKAQMDADTTPRRRGRPPGAKNKNPSLAAIKKQAPVTVVVEAAPEEAPEPVLHSYKCKWVKCHGDLHNLDTLKRHVYKQHFPADTDVKENGLICWWKKCQYLEPDGDGNMAPVHAFQSRDEWESHINEDHLYPIAMKYGDGPKATNTGKQKPLDRSFGRFLYKPQFEPPTRTCSYTDSQTVEMDKTQYLADGAGRATTPLVSSDGNADHPRDAMILTKSYPQGATTDKEKADIAAQKAFHKAHGNKHKDGKGAAEETIRAMEVRKQKLGPGLDRGGCTLINEARRATFMQAPGISRIVDHEY